MALESIAFFALSIALLALSSEMLIYFATRVGKEFRVGNVAVGFFLVSISTSFPELSIAVTSSLFGNPSLSAGNLVGSSVADLLWVLGITAVVGNVVVQGKHFLESTRNILLMAAIPIMVFFRGELDWIAAVVLFCVMALFFFEIHGTIERKRKLPSVLLPSTGFLEAQQQKFGQESKKKKWEAIQGFGLGCMVLIASAFMVTQSASQLASDFGIRQTIIGITLLSISTTLPETAVNLSAIRRKRVELALGNLFGSVVINLGLGGLIIALLHPSTLNISVLRPALATLLGLTLLYWALSKRIQSVSRRQGMALLAAYAIFLAAQFLVGKN